MVVRIRLKRVGRKNRPFYRMCVFDGRTRRDGQPIEELGSYDPRGETLDSKLNIDARRAWYWLGVGAQPSETCASLLRKLGVRKGGSEPAEPIAPEEQAVEPPVAEPVLGSVALAAGAESDAGPAEALRDSTDATPVAEAENTDDSAS